MQIEITPDKAKKPVPTLEEKITNIANSWAQSLIDDEYSGGAFIREGLSEAVNNKIADSLGLRLGHSWDGDKIEVDLYADRPLAHLIKEYADLEVKRIIDEIEFEPVVLTQNEVNAIQRAYRTRIKEHAIEAARNLAERKAIDFAKTVLGLTDTED